MAVVFLLSSLVLRIGLFFKHWYYDSFLFLYGVFLRVVRSCERSYAIRLNTKYLFTKLPSDDSVVEYSFHAGVRIIKVIVGWTWYVFFGLLLCGVYSAWAMLPVYCMYKIMYG